MTSNTLWINLLANLSYKTNIPKFTKAAYNTMNDFIMPTVGDPYTLYAQSLTPTARNIENVTLETLQTTIKNNPRLRVELERFANGAYINHPDERVRTLQHYILKDTKARSVLKKLLEQHQTSESSWFWSLPWLSMLSGLGGGALLETFWPSKNMLTAGGFGALAGGLGGLVAKKLIKGQIFDEDFVNDLVTSILAGTLGALGKYSITPKVTTLYNIPLQ